MLKKYNQFIVEGKEIPGPNNPKSKMIVLSDSEVELFASEPVLETLISDNKVSLLAPELWYISTDTETINILSNFFEINNESDLVEEGFQSKRIGEDESNSDNEIESETLTCPYCKEETHYDFPENDIETIECDNCLEEFEASRIISYISRKID